MKDPSRYIIIISNTNAQNDTVIPVPPHFDEPHNPLQSAIPCTTNIIQNGVCYSMDGPMI